MPSVRSAQRLPLGTAGICMVKVLFRVPVLVILTPPVARVAGEAGSTPVTLMIAAQTLPVSLSRVVQATEADQAGARNRRREDQGHPDEAGAPGPPPAPFHDLPFPALLAG